MSSVPPSTNPMASFLDLPPETRQPIYTALLVDPIRDKARRVYTMDALGDCSWSRVVRPIPIVDESASDNPPIKPSVSHVDYSDLWSLARANKLLYVEVTPIMYSHAQLEYTSGDNSCAHANQTFLHTYLEKLSPITSTLYHNLTVIECRPSARTTKLLVDLINSRFPNLISLSIQAINPAAEGWPEPEISDLLIGALEITKAARPVARLASRPILSIESRAFFYLRHEPFISDPVNSLLVHLLTGVKWSTTLGTSQSLVDIRDWRREAQTYHANACEQGEYLLLTSSLRSTSDEAEDTNATEELDHGENGLGQQQKVLSQITDYRRMKIQHATLLRSLKRV